MKDFTPTHFIEQYNKVGEYKRYASQQFAFTDPLPIKFLSNQLGSTANCNNIKTVAIFKIQLKQST